MPSIPKSHVLAFIYTYILKEAPVVMAGVQLVVHVRSLCVYFTFD